MELVERDDELERLASALGQASTGAGRTVLVRGEAGIGKTALVRAFIDRIEGGDPDAGRGGGGGADGPGVAGRGR